MEMNAYQQKKKNDQMIHTSEWLLALVSFKQIVIIELHSFVRKKVNWKERWMYCIKNVKNLESHISFTVLLNTTNMSVDYCTKHSYKFSGHVFMVFHMMCHWQSVFAHILKIIRAYLQIQAHTLGFTIQNSFYSSN
jgi:hypothetical protein